MTWNTYGLDQAAQKLVLKAKKEDPKSLNQSHKMRMATAYGLERFWGEHLRLQKKEPKKSAYWKDTWDAFVEIMNETGLEIPNDDLDVDNIDQVQKMSEKLWDMEQYDIRIGLAVLTQLCDCIVWWTQRHKGPGEIEE